MLSDDFLAGSPEEFEQQLERLIADLPASLLQRLRIVLAGCGQGALALWREPGVDPALVAHIEELTRLDEGRVRRMLETEDHAAIGRLLLTAPCRLHAFTALGIALFHTPLLTRFTAYMNEPGRLEAGAWDQLRAAAVEIGQELLGRLEQQPKGEFFDVEDLLQPGADPQADVLRFTGEGLRQRRLQLETLIEQTLGHYQPPAAAWGAPEPEESPTDAPAADALADESLAAADPQHPLHTFYHGPLLQTSFLPAQITMLLLAATLPQTLLMLPGHRFGAVRRMHWVGNAARLTTMTNRLARTAPDQPVELSFTEVMLLYQGAQVVALALVQEVLPEIDEAMAELWQQLAEEDPDLVRTTAPFPSLSAHFAQPADEDGNSSARLVCGMVEGFVTMVKQAIGDFASQPEASDLFREYPKLLAVAQREVDAFATEIEEH